MTQHFDVTVIGAQRSGILAAALLAKRGRRVVLVDHSDKTQWYRHGAFELPLMPSLAPVFIDSPTIDLIHRELGLGPELRQAGTPQDPSFQAVLPTHRIDIRPRREALLDELRLEFPDLAEPLRAFFERLYAIDAQISKFLEAAPPLPPSGFREHLQLRAALRQADGLDQPLGTEMLFAGIPHDHAVRQLLLGPLVFFGHLHADAPSVCHAARLMARYFRGTVCFDGHPGGLTDLLLQSAERSGVEMRRATAVERLVARRRRIVGFELLQDRNPCTTEFVIANAASPLHRLLPTEKKASKFAAEEQAAQASRGMLVLNLVVKTEVIPYGMGRTVFLLNGRRQPRDEEQADTPLMVRRGPARLTGDENGRGREDKQLEVLTVAYPVHATDLEAPHGERMKALKHQIVQRLSRMIPFLRDFIVDVSVSNEPSPGVDTPSSAPALDVWRWHPLFEPAKKPLLGIALRPTRTYYKNVVRCGPDVLPGLGIEGEYVAALSAVRTIEQLAGRKWRRIVN